MTDMVKQYRVHFIPLVPPLGSSVGLRCGPVLSAHAFGNPSVAAREKMGNNCWTGWEGADLVSFLMSQRARSP